MTFIACVSQEKPKKKEKKKAADCQRQCIAISASQSVDVENI